MKNYQKPISRSISDLVVGAGFCTSGTNPTEQCNPTGAVNSAYCRAGSYNSFSACASSGIGATGCAPTGKVAGLELGG